MLNNTPKQYQAPNIYLATALWIMYLLKTFL